MQKEVVLNSPYLCIPIHAGREYSYFTISDGDELLYEYRLPCFEEAAGEDYEFFYGVLNVRDAMGKKVILGGEYPKNFFALIKNCEKEEMEELTKKEESRSKLHFTADRGWINDPNGLVYDGKQYHLYFQYNPVDIEWGNMSWGHAVSQDLLHFTQTDTVLHPDEFGAMFSGSAIINERALLGLPKDALIYFYTVAGDNSPWSKDKKFTQNIAYSLDGGQSLIKRGKPCLEWIEGGNRDPKVFWHEESGAYIMVLYIDQNDFMIFRSDDLENWTMTQKLTLEDCWECPDLVRLPVEGGGEVWMFWCADGFHYFGQFDGYKFTSDGVRHKAYLGRTYYAAQTYSGIKDRVVTVPWLRLPNLGKLYTGAMGIPRELSAVKTEKGYGLIQKPVRELNEKWDEVTREACKGIERGKESLDASFQLNLNGREVSYRKEDNCLLVGPDRLDLDKAYDQLEYLVDENIVEFTLSDQSETKIAAFQLY